MARPTKKSMMRVTPGNNRQDAPIAGPWQAYWDNHPRRGADDRGLPAKISFWRACLDALARRQADTSILDLGTGRACFWPQVARTVSDAFTLHAVDCIDLYDHDICTLQDIRLSQMDVERLTFPDAAFDAVMATDLLEYTDDRKMLGEACRVLKPSGWAILLVRHPECETDQSFALEQQQYARYKHVDLYGLMESCLHGDKRARTARSRIISTIEHVSGLRFNELMSFKADEQTPVITILYNFGRWLDKYRNIRDPQPLLKTMRANQQYLESILERYYFRPDPKSCFSSPRSLAVAAQRAGIEDPVVHVLADRGKPIRWILAFAKDPSGVTELNDIVRAAAEPTGSFAGTRLRSFLQRQARLYNRKIRFNRANVFGADAIRSATDRRQQLNKFYHQQIGRASERAAAGLSMVDLGAGWLEQHTRDALTSPEYSRIILMDIDPDAPCEALWDHDLAHLLGDRIVVASADLSLVSDGFIQRVEQVIDPAQDFDAAVSGIGALYNECRAGACPVVDPVVPPELGRLLCGDKAGLAISTGLFTPLSDYVRGYIASLLRTKPGAPAGISDDEMMLKTSSTLASFSRYVVQEIHNGHGQLLQSILAPQGIVVHCRDLVRVNRGPCAKLEFQSSQQGVVRGIEASGLARSLGELSRQYLGRLDCFDEVGSVAIEAWRRFMTGQDGGAFEWFVPWVVLNAAERGRGPRLTMGDQQWDQWWSSSFDLLDTQVVVWHLFDAPIIFQSVTARSRGCLNASGRPGDADQPTS